MGSLFRRVPPRDAFFFLLGAAILYHELWQLPTPSPLGLFMVIFFWGLIPAFRGEEHGSSPWDVLAKLLGAVSSASPASPASLESEEKAGQAGQVAPPTAPARQDTEARAGQEDPT